MIFEKNGNTLRIIQKGRQQLVYGLSAFSTGVVIATIGLFFQQLPLLAVGAFFTIMGMVMMRYVETRTTTITTDGTITIVYKRMIGGRQWIRRLDRTDVLSLDYVKGFDENEVDAIGDRCCTIYLNVTFNEQIEIAEKYRVNWDFNKFGIPSSKQNTPLDVEAAEIGRMLGLPVNTISYVKVKDTLNSIYTPRDKMAPILQRPTQKQLDSEHSVHSSNQPLQ